MLKHYVGFDGQTCEEVGGNINRLKDSEGRTWKELKKTFSKGTWKVGYTKQGGILTVQKDVNLANIGGCYGVCEIENIPKEFTRAEGYKWYFNVDTLQIERDPLLYEHLRDKKMKTAIQNIQIHEIKEAMTPRPAMFFATSEAPVVEPMDSALWMNYLYDLARVDTSLMEDIEWPEKPKT